MTDIYELACHTCKVKLWAGHERGGHVALYDATWAGRTRIELFLEAHMAHALGFFDSRRSPEYERVSLVEEKR